MCVAGLVVAAEAWEVAGDCKTSAELLTCSRSAWRWPVQANFHYTAEWFVQKLLAIQEKFASFGALQQQPAEPESPKRLYAQHPRSVLASALARSLERSECVVGWPTSQGAAHDPCPPASVKLHVSSKLHVIRA
jgi:hypothetical protein